MSYNYKVGDKVRLTSEVVSPTADFSQGYEDLKRIPVGTEAVVEGVEYGEVFVTFPGEPYDGWYAGHFELAE